MFPRQKVMENTPTITHSWSNVVHRGITDDRCNWHCITNLIYSLRGWWWFPSRDDKDPRKSERRKRWPAPRLVRIGGTTLKIHGTVFRSLVQSEFSLICQGERGWRQIENNSSDYGNICNVRGKKSRSRANGVVCGGKLSLAAPSFLSRQSDFTAFVTAGL